MSGTLIDVNLSNRSAQLRTGSGIVNLVWSNASLLPPNLGALLNRKVEVEYQVIGGENRLRKLKPD
jgi:hypothetical protein